MNRNRVNPTQTGPLVSQNLPIVHNLGHCRKFRATEVPAARLRLGLGLTITTEGIYQADYIIESI